jgi:hypothetical protein
MIRYHIRKTIINEKTELETNVLLTNGYSEILEYGDKHKAELIVSVLRDKYPHSTWGYKVIPVGK